MRNLKKILALVLALVMALSLMTVASAKSLGEYTDAANVSAEYKLAVDFTTQLGVLQGMSENNYAPQGTLTRAQLATMIYRITTGDVAGKYVANYAAGAANQFSDVPAAHWAAGYIAYCADAGYLKGVGNNKYDPNGTLTGYQALAALLRAIGYNKNNDFTGSDWTVKVAEVAYQSNVMAGVFANLNGSLTREQAAKLVYNALWATKVSYTAAFGYSTLGQTSLVRSVFGIDSVVTGRDLFQRPSTQWKAGSVVKVEIADAPLFTTNVATTQCALATALGEKAGFGVNVFENGAQKYDTTYYATATTAVVGAQGTQVEVYAAANGEYDVIVIETWLAKTGKVTKATFDAAGHLKTPAITALTVYNPAGTLNWTVDTEAYAEGTYLLVNISATKGTQIVGVATPVATAKLTAYTAATTTVGNVYNNAAKFALNAPVPAAVNKTWNVYVDQFGNIIGLVEPAAVETVYNYGLITDIAWQPSIGLASEYIAANLLAVNNTAIPNVVIGNAWTNAGYSAGQKDVSVGYNKAENGAYYNKLAKFHVENGKYVVDAWGTELTNAITNPTKGYIESNSLKYTVNANTVYLVKTLVAGVPTYTTYTGYANVPAMSKTTATFFADKNNAYVAYVYIDATGAEYPGSTGTVVLFDTDVDVYAANYQYEAWIGAEKITLTTVGQTALPGAHAGLGTYVATYNAAGQVIGMKEVLFGTAAGTAVLDVKYCDGLVMRNKVENSLIYQDAIQYTCDTMTVYVMDTATKTISVGTYADVLNTTAYLYLNAAGTAVVAAYVVK